MTNATHSLPATSNKLSLLRLALLLDAAVTGVNGAAYWLAAEPLADLLGVSPLVQRSLGAFLLAYAVMVAVIATRPVISIAAASEVVALNALWAIASVVVAIAGTFSPSTAGTVWTVMQAGTVAGFAALQAYALRRQA